MQTTEFRRDVTIKDLDSVREIIHSSGFFRDHEIDVAVELVNEALQKGDASGYYFLFSDMNDRVMGYACFGPIACTEFSYDLYWIAVHEEMRGSGIGKRLLRASEEEIAKRGGRRIYIETSSQPLYEPTRQFYLKCGYRIETILEDFYAPGDGKVIFVKAVG